LIQLYKQTDILTVYLHASMLVKYPEAFYQQNGVWKSYVLYDSEFGEYRIEFMFKGKEW